MTRVATDLEARLILWSTALHDAEKSARLACFLHRSPESGSGSGFGVISRAGFPAFQESLEAAIRSSMERPVCETYKYALIRASYEHAIVRFCSIFNSGKGLPSGPFPVAENKSRAPNEADELRMSLTTRVESKIAEFGEVADYLKRVAIFKDLRDQVIAHSDATYLRPEVHITDGGFGHQAQFKTYALLHDQRFDDAVSLLYVIHLWQWAINEAMSAPAALGQRKPTA
jgi:hypothetical protein